MFPFLLHLPTTSYVVSASPAVLNLSWAAADHAGQGFPQIGGQTTGRTTLHAEGLQQSVTRPTAGSTASAFPPPCGPTNPPLTTYEAWRSPSFLRNRAHEAGLYERPGETACTYLMWPGKQKTNVPQTPRMGPSRVWKTAFPRL